jgi:hypothetical protein
VPFLGCELITMDSMMFVPPASMGSEQGSPPLTVISAVLLPPQ